VLGEESVGVGMERGSRKQGTGNREQETGNYL
jgi:hypothetical protein